MSWFGNTRGHQVAGRKGGKAKQIGPRGFARNKELASQAGKKGGEVRRKPVVHYGEERV